MLFLNVFFFPEVTWLFSMTYGRHWVNFGRLGDGGWVSGACSFVALWRLSPAAAWLLTFFLCFPGGGEHFIFEKLDSHPK